MSEIYNANKVPETFDRFRTIKVWVMGAGAVGTWLIEHLIKCGVSVIYINDFDHYTKENASKHGALIRTPEDADQPKAIASAGRGQVLMRDGGKCIGVQANVTSLGPMAFSGTDVVFVAYDNYAAKRYMNQVLLHIPEEKRPIVIMGGTYRETATAVRVDMKTACLLDVHSLEWFKNGEVRTSCTGPQYLQEVAAEEGGRTSAAASSLAAYLMFKLFYLWAIGTVGKMNCRITDSILFDEPMNSWFTKRNDCPDCDHCYPPATVRILDGSVLTLTLENALSQITASLGTDDFELCVYLLEFGGVGYNDYITDDYCHCCGKPIEVYAHAGRTHFTSVLCDDCRKDGKSAYQDTSRPVGRTIRAFTVDTDSTIKGRTLFDLGYPVGAYLTVICRHGGMNALDENREVIYFTCDNDNCLTEKSIEL